MKEKGEEIDRVLTRRKRRDETRRDECLKSSVAMTGKVPPVQVDTHALPWGRISVCVMVTVEDAVNAYHRCFASSPPLRADPPFLSGMFMIVTEVATRAWVLVHTTSNGRVVAVAVLSQSHAADD